ncbi:hypothetical protein CSB89_1605 [Pseudomonas aeruginosa]|nr:hypothetical protein CSB89_1605 [Pseudomonas aeruginosa]
MGHPPWLLSFHFQRRPQRRMAARRPFAPFPGPRRAASQASQRNRDGRPATY